MECYTDSEFGEERGHIVWIIQAVSSSISLFGSCFILVNFFVLSHGNNPLVQLVALLSLGDVGWAVVKLIHFALNMIDFNWTEDNFYGCVAIRLLWQFFAGTTIIWTCCISFFLWRTVCRKSQGSRLQWIFFHLISWGLPLVSIIALAAGGHTTMTHSNAMGTCYPTWYLHISLWFLPVVLCFLFNTILYIAIAWSIRRTLKLIPTLAPKRTQYVYRKFTFYILVYIICWPLDITNSVLHYSRGPDQEKCHYFVLVCIYSALLNMQGFLNFIVYGFTNKRIYAQFFGGEWFVTLKACLVFCFSPFLFIPVALWYTFSTVQSRIYSGSTRMTKEEIEHNRQLLEAKKEREERARRMAKQVWGNERREHRGSIREMTPTSKEKVSESTATILTTGEATTGPTHLPISDEGKNIE